MNFKHSFSLNGECFEGDFFSYDSAAEIAFNENPDSEFILVGINNNYSALDFIDGRQLLEIISENAYDECGESAFNWLQDLQENVAKVTEFEKIISDWLDSNAPVTFFTVDEIKEFNRPKL